MVTKFCPWDCGVCSRSSCDLILPNGCVLVCGRHANPNGRLTPRLHGFSFVFIFSKHLKGGSP